MPWKAFKKENEWCVFKLDQAGKQIGSRLDCHPTEVAANRQVRALEASEMDRQIKEGDEMPEEDEVKEELETKAHVGGMEASIPIGITSFSDLDAAVEAQEMVKDMKLDTAAFAEMAENIFFNSEIENKASALQSLANEFQKRIAQNANKELDEKAVWTRKFINTLPDSSFLFIEKGGKKDEEGKTKPRSLRHFPYKDTAGKVDLPHIRNAIARIPQSTAKGLNKEALQTKARRILENTQKELDDIGLIDKAIMKFKEIMGIKDRPKLDGGFYVWKEADGYKWMSVYSNNIKDNDNPPDIISSKSHQRFVEMVDKGEAPLPELWLWHVPEWKWGDATGVAYDDKGFAVAIGKVDDNLAAVAVADWLEERKDIKTSHGMPRPTVKREQDEKGNQVIVEHITREISPLFNFAAANKYTGFSILKEVDMIPEHKKEEFIKQGLAADVLDELEKQNKATDKETEALEKKEEETTTQEPQAAQTEEQPLNRQEVVEAFAKIAEVITPLAEQVKALTDEMKEIKEERVGNIPRASLDAVVDNLFNKDTQVDGRSSLAKSKPKETEIQPEDEQFFINQFLGGDRPSILNREVS